LVPLSAGSDGGWAGAIEINAYVKSYLIQLLDRAGAYRRRNRHWEIAVGR